MAVIHVWTAFVCYIRITRNCVIVINRKISKLLIQSSSIIGVHHFRNMKYNC